MLSQLSLGLDKIEPEPEGKAEAKAPIPYFSENIPAETTKGNNGVRPDFRTFVICFLQEGRGKEFRGK